MRFKALPYKTKQFFAVLIKLSIVVGAFYFIYGKISNNNDLSRADFFKILSEIDLFSIKTLVFLTILTCFNWFFEILKWQNLVSMVETISLKAAMKQALMGGTASLITPNRLGEYGAKALCFPSKFRKKIVLLNLVGHLMQMSTTLLFGCVGLIYFNELYPLTVPPKTAARLIAALVAALFLFKKGIQQKHIKLKGNPLTKIVQFLFFMPKAIVFKCVFYSVVRYLFFSFQFYYLIRLFNYKLGYLEAMVGITTVYLLASLIPSFVILDVVIKGSVAVFVFSFLGIETLHILSIVTVMWFLNFAIPSIIGSYYVLAFKLPKTSMS